MSETVKKGRKFFVLILMTAVNVLYIGASIIKPAIMELMPLMMMLDGVFGAFMGLNVAQKKIQSK